MIIGRCAVLSKNGYLMPLGNGNFFLPLTLIFLISNPALVPGTRLLLAQRAEPGSAVWDVKLAPNTSTKSSLTVINECEEEQSFTITLKNLPYLRLLAEPTVIVPGHSSQNLPVSFNTTGMKPGEYQGTVLVKRNTYRKERTCQQDRQTIPVRLTVTQVVATPTATRQTTKIDTSKTIRPEDLPVGSKGSLPNLSQYAGVRYNSAYGVLEFEDEGTFNATVKILQAQDENFTGDNGDTAGLSALLNQRPPLPPKELKDKLLAASPLSDAILIGVLNKTPSLPPDIIQDIFIANTSFSDEVSNKLKTSALPQSVLSRILEADDDDTIIEDTVLDAFERLFKFRSLRKEIEGKEKLLLEKGIDPEQQDADDFFIQDVYLRTLLNPQLEIKIGSSIYKFINEKTLVRITNADFKSLEQLRKDKHVTRFAPPRSEPINGIPESQVTTIIPPNIVVESLAPSSPCDAKFDFSATAAGKISFKNLSTGTPTISFLWNFGDGYISYQKDPVHSFGNGKFLVTLQVADGLGNMCAYSREIVVGVCSAGWTFTLAAGKVSFTSKPADVIPPVTYQWDFGDGHLSNDPNPIHTYTSSGTRNVCLTITDAAKCSNTVCKLVSVTVEPVEPECCDKNDRDKGHWIPYASDRKFKYSIWQTNIPFYHRWGAKTKNYRYVEKKKKKKKTGKWKEQKAEEIGAGVSGTVYGKNTDGEKCEVPVTTSLVDTKRKKDHVNFNYAAGSVFWTKRHSILSTHYVLYNGTRYPNSTTLYLTTDCPP